MPTRRLLPPTSVAYQTRTVNGRIYSGQPGQAIDLPDFDTAMLSANGWIDCGLTGASNARPVSSARTMTRSGHLAD
jgi:hypothetical protein